MPRFWYLSSEETRPIIVKSGYYRTLEISEMRVQGFIPARGRCHVHRGCKDVLRVPRSQAAWWEEQAWTSFLIRCRSIRRYIPEDTQRELLHSIPHLLCDATRCIRARICKCTNVHVHMHAERWQARTRALAHSTRGSPPFGTMSWNLGTASDVLVSTGSRGGESKRITRGKEYKPPGARRKTGHSRLLLGFGWDTYICQSSREGNASPTFTWASPELCLNPLTLSTLPPCSRIFPFRISFLTSLKI